MEHVAIRFSLINFLIPNANCSIPILVNYAFEQDTLYALASVINEYKSCWCDLKKDGCIGRVMSFQEK